MELSTWLLYVSVIGVLIASPGPSALLCVSDGLKFGNKRTIPTILGGATASLVLMSISAVGLGAILTASETLFVIIKILGALYLIYLGLHTWKNGNIPTNHNTQHTNTIVHYSRYLLFRKGFMVGVSNPKGLLFFIALFPSFVNADLPQVEQYAILASTWFVVDVASMFIYAVLGSKIIPLLSKKSHLIIINRSIGGIFIFLGGALAISAGISKKIL